jgi:hypothetical protein
MAGLLVVAGSDRDAAVEAVGANRREEAAVRVGLRQQDPAVGDGQDDPARIGQRQLGPEFLFRHVAEPHAEPLGGEATNGHRIEVDAEHLIAIVGEPAEELRAEAAETEDDDLDRLRLRLVVGAGLAPAEIKACQERRQPIVELVGIGDHVDRDGDGHEPDQRDEADGGAVDMAEAEAHRHEDQRELRDLRDGEPGKEAGAGAVPHPRHDQEDDQRVADQHEDREDRGAAEIAGERRQIERGADRQEEEQQQEIAKRGEPRRDHVAVGRGAERDAGGEAAELLAEAERVADGRRRRRPADRRDHQQLRRPGEARHQRIGEIAHEQDEQHGDGDEGEQDRRQRGKAALPVGRADSDRREHDHSHHHDDVLDDEEAEGDPPVQRLQLALVAEQLHHDDGRGEGERHRDIDAGEDVEPECDPDQEADARREDYLAEAGRQRHRAELGDQPPVELQPDEEEQQRDAQFGQEVDLLRRLRAAVEQRRGGNADGDEADDHGLAQQGADHAHCGGDEQQEGDLVKDDVGHGAPCRQFSVQGDARGKRGAGEAGGNT